MTLRNLVYSLLNAIFIVFLFSVFCILVHGNVQDEFEYLKRRCTYDYLEI